MYKVVRNTKFMRNSNFWLKLKKKTDSLFLLETTVNETHIKGIIFKMGYDNSDYSSPVSHSGGIWVLYNTNNNVLANVLFEDTRAMHLLVFDIFIQKFSIVSSAYAPAQLHDKTGFLEPPCPP